MVILFFHFFSRNGKAIRLTYDHKGSDPAEKQRIRAAGGFVLNERVNGMLAITRALGDAELKSYVSGNPYTAEITIDKSYDSFLVVACDGLWDVVSDQACCDYITAKLNRNDINPNIIAEELVDLAIREGSADNISIIVVLFKFSK
jgi:protein phosphatase PTC1